MTKEQRAMLGSDYGFAILPYHFKEAITKHCNYNYKNEKIDNVLSADLGSLGKFWKFIDGTTCDYFVMGNGYGERDLSCDYNIEDNKKEIKKITLEELSKMLDVHVNEYGEIIEENCYDNTLFYALQETLKKKGISYEDYIKQFSNNQ